MDDDIKRMFLEDYAKGQGTFVLSKKYNLSPTTLTRILHLSGVQPRRKLGKRIPLERIKQLVDTQIGYKFKMLKFAQAGEWRNLLAWLKGYRTLSQMAKELGVSNVSFNGYLRELGMKYPKLDSKTIASWYVEVLRH